MVRLIFRWGLMRKRVSSVIIGILFLMLASLGLLYFTGEAHAYEFDVNDGDRFVSDYDARYTFPNSSAMRLAGKSRCSGAVVGKDYVMTAAHCWNASLVKVYNEHGRVVGDWYIDKDASHYHPRWYAYGDLALVKVDPIRRADGTYLHLGDVRRPLTVIDNYHPAKGTNLTSIGYPKWAGDHQQVTRKNTVRDIKKDALRTWFSGGGGGLSGAPLVNNEGQLIGVYHGSNPGVGWYCLISDNLYSNKLNERWYQDLLNNTKIREETARIYFYPDAAAAKAQRAEIDPEGTYLEKHIDEPIASDDLFDQASKVLPAGHHAVTLIDGVRKVNEGSGIRMPLGGYRFYVSDSKPNTYTIQFDGNASGVSGTMKDESAVYDSPSTLSGNNLSRKGYTFTGWNTSKDGTGRAYRDGESVSNLTKVHKGKVTLYAQWKANTYAVTFNPNKGQGVMKKQDFVYDAAQNLSGNAFARPGFTFSGWNTKEDGSGQTYADGESVSNLTYASDGGVTLYAQWTRNQESALVTYLDDTDEERILSTQKLTGLFDSRDSYRTKATIDTYRDAGYELVSDNYPSEGVLYDQPGIVQHFEVHLKHLSLSRDETRDVQQKINYIYIDGKKAADSSITNLSFIRTLATDKVTNQITYGDWKPLGGSSSFPPVISPKIIGYTPSQDRLEEVSGVTGDTPDQEITITYAPNKEEAKVVYRDDTLGTILSTEHLFGSYGSTSDYRTVSSIDSYQKAGYVLAADEYPITGDIFGKDGVVQVFEVHLQHGITTTNESKQVRQTIHFLSRDGSKLLDDRQFSLTFRREVRKDNVTQEVTYGDWTPLEGETFPAVDVPRLDGYIPQQARVPAVEHVSGNDADTDVTVTYKAEETKGLSATGVSLEPILGLIAMTLLLVSALLVSTRRFRRHGRG